MKTRILTAVIAIPLLLAVIISSGFYPMILQIVISLACGLMCFEFLSARGLQKDYRFSIIYILLGVLSPLLMRTKFKFVPLYIFIIVLAIVAIISHKTVKIEDMFFMCAGVLFIMLPMSSFSYLAPISGKAPFWCVLVLAIPWLSDTGAYFTGTYFGKRKLCPEISPKKTVEGAIGGIIASILAAVIVGLIFQFIVYPHAKINYPILILIGVTNSVLSIVGDLIFSLIKRWAGIKDYGFILPGHGGLLDRMDSVLFSIPAVFILAQITTIIS